jgi:hypothetical protein
MHFSSQEEHRRQCNYYYDDQSQSDSVWVYSFERTLASFGRFYVLAADHKPEEAYLDRKWVPASLFYLKIYINIYSFVFTLWGNFLIVSALNCWTCVYSVFLLSRTASQMLQIFIYIFINGQQQRKQSKQRHLFKRSCSLFKHADHTALLLFYLGCLILHLNLMSRVQRSNLHQNYTQIWPELSNYRRFFVRMHNKRVNVSILSKRWLKMSTNKKQPHHPGKQFNLRIITARDKHRGL